ncbi:transketolase [Rhodotorula toruloides]|uniref:Transketolase n=1 Tax=Rhodotorula toruloides TaxID=5286 RepID=A0A511KPE0_RHOTO|nr:transketolase [Rhodotorula toruloides]
MPFQPNDNDQKAINTIRTLALDTVNKANSGHPGAPMGMAPVAHVLFSRFFQCNPRNPHWVNRDRFVLSNGHACALQYVLLHLLGYKVSIDDLKQFRQLDSITPGHPEVGVTEGIEVTTGPLGQGFANAVGLAIAQAHLGAVFNKDNYSLFDNYTYMFTGDGCLMEGVSAEAASLAGHLKLGNLIAIYDDNQISIDGSTAIAFTEDVGKRFEAYDWQVLHVENGNDDLKAISDAIEQAKAEKNKPTLIRLKTTIGYGSRDQGTHGVHGNPLKADDTVEIKKKFGFDPEQFFVVPEETKKIYQDIAQRGAEAEKKWQAQFNEYEQKFPEEAKDIKRRIDGKLPDGWEKALPEFKPTDDAVASRKLSEMILAKLSTVVPELVSGSADLTPSNLTRWKNAVDFQPKENGLGDYTGRYIRYGVREHGMGAIANGIAAYGGNLVLPAVGTFLNFVSYAAGAVRLTALSHLRVIWVATHDSLGLGEDGPTHQPVETVAHFRAMPNVHVWRPADGNETSAAYYSALTSTHTPSILCLSRQNLPQLATSSIEKARRGGYIVHDVADAHITLAATGSEVALAVEVAEVLKKNDGVLARVVSFPCLEVFDAQSLDYRLSVLPDGHPIVSIEPYVTQGWTAYAHETIGMKTFGASGPAKAVFSKFGFDVEQLSDKAKRVVKYYSDRQVVSPLRRAL